MSIECFLPLFANEEQIKAAAKMMNFMFLLWMV
jgi:hypothetical protein